MKINLSPEAVEAIFEIQESPILIGIIEDAENFILENIDNETGDDEKEAMLSRQTLSHIRGLRSIRKLLVKICEEGSES
jgi:hypothetical protein